MDPEVLKKAPLFAGLEDEAASALAAAMGTIKLNQGEVLFHEGDKEDRLYVVVSGKIKLGRSGSAGRENLLAILGPGQMFGELSLFDPGPAIVHGHRGDGVRDPDPRARRADGLAGRSTGGRPRPAGPACRPAAPRQRRGRRPGLLRRAGSGGQAAARAAPDGSATDARTASTSTTTSPRRSSPSWSAPPARRSTRPWPTSPPAAGSGSSPARSPSWTRSGWSAARADPAALRLTRRSSRRTTRNDRGARPSPGVRRGRGSVSDDQVEAAEGHLQPCAGPGRRGCSVTVTLVPGA